ncbi:hypothetical protein [[Phormidium] sp. ETS-05]|uniref:hypothetical protein n=1 Tax=[Phormidium] sp. ETS-05 TaxID=222819 RepID=UPI0018EED8F7|nr:hypothetical protein [[Phormidium] sp. ETS-05]
MFYKLVLTCCPPVADVTIAINTDDQITTDVPTVTFTPSNWNLPQTVTVTAVDDSELEGNHQGNITPVSPVLTQLIIILTSAVSSSMSAIMITEGNFPVIPTRNNWADISG